MAENTPDSEVGSIECFQNYTAPEVFVQGLAGIVDQQDVESMIRAQKQMLQRFEKTNEMLTNCNTLCVTRLKLAAAEFKKHTQLLCEMRKDLDGLFRRIQNLKLKTSTQYPQAFAAAVEALKKEEVESEVSTPSIEDTIELPEDDPTPSPVRRNSSSSDSPNISQHDSSPCTSDTG